MTYLKLYTKPSKSGKKSTLILDPHSLNQALKDPFELKELESLNLIKAHLQKHKRCVVMTSYGKDSLVMMDLCVRAAKELGIEPPEFWLNDTLNTYQEEKEFWSVFNEWMSKVYDIKIKWRIFTPPKLPNGKQATVWSIAEFVGHLPDFRRAYKKGQKKNSNKTPECCDILKKESVKNYLKTLKIEERVDCEFIGERAEESRSRRLAVLQFCRSHITKWKRVYPVMTVKPLSFWVNADIWFYIEKRKLPKNPAYDLHKQKRLGCASCPAHRFWELRLARDPTPTGQGMLKQNLLLLKKYGEIERYDKAIKSLKKYKLALSLVAELEGQDILK